MGRNPVNEKVRPVEPPNRFSTSDPDSPCNSSATSGDRPAGSSPRKHVLWIALATMAGMALYQGIKYLINPNITLIESNVITVIFATLVASITAHLVLRHQTRLYQKAMNEVARREKVEADLRRTQDELEQRIAERTRELTTSNDRLQSEISVRRQAEEALRESEAKYRTWFEEAAISLTTFDHNGRVEYINKYHLKTFARNKFDRDFFIGKKISELPAIVGGHCQELISQVFTGKTVEINEVYCPKFSGGHSGYMNIRAVPLIRNSEVIGGILIREDVTSIKTIEAELRRVNRAQETILACHRVLVQDTDEKTLLADICQAFVNIGGYRLAWIGFAEHDTDKTISHVAHAGFENGYLDTLDVSWGDDASGQGPSGQAIRSGKPVIMGNILTDPQFTPWRERAVKRGYASTVALPLIIHGRTIGVLRIYCQEPDAFDEREVKLIEGLTVDIAYGLMTRRMQAERQKAKEERLRLESQLRQAQKMEAIGTLAGGIAHDFNNILGAMLGFTQLALIEASPDSKLRAHLDRVRLAGDRATELVKQILAFSRQSESEFKPLQIGPVVKEVLKLLRASLPSTIDIKQKITAAGTALADPIQIHQVVMNLATNAAQAMGEKGGLLTVELRETKLDVDDATRLGIPAGNYLQLTVSDTGPGISPKIIDRIFDPYFTTKSPGEGTGLGLAMVHGIVRSHRGTIKVYSEVGVGSTFIVFLPCIAAAMAEEVFRAPPVVGGTERILYVDDEVALVEFVREALKMLGYQMTVSTSSLEALQMVRENPHNFDLVITDQTMPQLTGLNLAIAIRHIRPEIPIILCTGFSTLLTADNIENAGIKATVMKPVLIHDLARAVRQALDSQPGHRGE